MFFSSTFLCWLITRFHRMSYIFQFNGETGIWNLSTLLLMHDALEELEELSRSLNSDSVTLQWTHLIICRQVEIFHPRKKTPADCEKSKIAKYTVKAGKCETISLKHHQQAAVLLSSLQFPGCKESACCQILTCIDKWYAKSASIHLATHYTYRI